MKPVVIGIACLGFIIVVALAGVGLGSMPQKTSPGDYLRLHIRANSNSPADQEVKYHVRQAIVDQLTPIFHDVESKEQAMYRLRDNLGLVERIARDTLKARGFNYGARVAIKSEHFPTRAYTTSDTQITLPEGVYDALIMELGDGEGDNWWSVIYPPLCFSGEAGIRYKFKLTEYK